MNRTVSFYTFGCRLNQSETAGIQNALEAGGYRVVPFKDAADVVVINTCTVTENGDADTRRMVNKVARQNPHSRIALVGCQAQVQKEQLAGLPNVRWIIGNGRKTDLREIFAECPDPATARVIVPTIGREAFTIDVATTDRDHTRANLKIQDGCDFFCSFCEIPYARGRARSRVFSDIVREAAVLVSGGHREIVLTGINIGTYGNDGKTIVDVVAALEEIQGLDRIRISSIEPTTISTELFDFMRPGRKLCRYLHVPLQSGDDTILQAMKRKYSVREFGDFLTLARRAVPEICIGTDVIVGFPGETDAHFERTVEFLREAPVDYCHVFSYSERQMAKSRLLGTRVPAETIRQRSRILRDLSQRKRRIFHETLLGTRQRVLFEEHKKGLWLGVTDNYVRVGVVSGEPLHNQMRDIVLDSVDGAIVRGRFA